MISYKGFHADLTCIGYQFQEDKEHITPEANCRQNGFHSAENPLDCLVYYPDWKHSVYYQVEAYGDLVETDEDSKIACTHLRLRKKLSLEELLAHGILYMVRYPGRALSCIVKREQGQACNGYVVVRGAHPKARGQTGDLLALVMEEQDRITHVILMRVGEGSCKAGVWYNVYGREETA